MLPDHVDKTLIVASSLYPKRSGSAIVMENLISQLDQDEVAVFGELGPFESPVERGIDAPSFEYFRSRFSVFGRGARYFSPLRNALQSKLVDRIARFAERTGCERILGVYPNQLFCHSAFLAAKKLGVPFSSYFHNTLSLIHISEPTRPY